MSNKMFTDLPVTGAASLTDIICADQGGISVQETLSQILTLMNTNLPYIPSVSWTPVFTFTTLGDLSVVYTVQGGTYTRIGNVIISDFVIEFTPTFTTATGVMNITGLPIASSSSSASFGTLQMFGMAFPPSCTNVSLLLAVGNNFINIAGSGSSLSSSPQLNKNQFTSGVACAIWGSITYLTS